LTPPAQLKEITARLGIPFIFKSSFDKANRTSGTSFRGPGLEEGLKVLDEVKRQIGVPVLTDVHEYTPMDEVARWSTCCRRRPSCVRQTDFIQKVASAGKPVNIKKGQFLSPWEMKHVVDKAKATGNEQIMVCERGASFGYNNLVSDMRSLAVMRDTGCPVVFDATHSVQLPGRAGQERWPARIRAGAGACRGCRRHLPACSWKPIRIRTRRCPTGRTPGRWERWKALIAGNDRWSRAQARVTHCYPDSPQSASLESRDPLIRDPKRVTTISNRPSPAKSLIPRQSHA
jgi:3-deoxy-8-phosphooctulonate synthase